MVRTSVAPWVDVHVSQVPVGVRSLASTDPAFGGAVVSWSAGEGGEKIHGRRWAAGEVTNFLCRVTTGEYVGCLL